MSDAAPRAVSTLASASAPARRALVRRGVVLNVVSLVYGVLESVLSLVAGVSSGSVSLLGFGIDSLIEVSASLVALWRLRQDHQAATRETAARHALRLTGALFLCLACYVTTDSVLTLRTHRAPVHSPLGLAILIASTGLMPLLASAKRRVAVALGSRALQAEATQTALCGWLSAIALAGVALSTYARWAWADPVAALAMVPIIAQEGILALRGQPHDCDHC